MKKNLLVPVLMFHLLLLFCMPVSAAGKITSIIITGIDTPQPGAFKDTTAVIQGADPHYRISGEVEWYERTPDFVYEPSNPNLPFKEKTVYEPRLNLVADAGYVFDDPDSLRSHIAINGMTGYLNVPGDDSVVISGDYELGQGSDTSITYKDSNSHSKIYAAGIRKGMTHTVLDPASCGLASYIPLGFLFDHWDVIANGRTCAYYPGDEFIVTKDAEFILKTRPVSSKNRIKKINVTYPKYKTCDTPNPNPAADFIITTEPTGAFRSDKLAALFAKEAFWMESEDGGVTFYMMPQGGEFTGRRKYYNNICNAIDMYMEELLKSDVVRDPSNPPTWRINGTTYTPYSKFVLHFYPYLLEDASVSVPDVTYNGDAQRPEPVVTFQGRTLVKGKDYTYSDSDYSKNVAPGTASLKLTGINSFSGPKFVTFTIREASADSMSAALAGNMITPQSPVSREFVGAVVTSMTGETDVPGSTYHLLRARAAVSKNKRIKLSWKKVPMADSYEIYAAPCKGGKFELAGTTPGTSWTQTGLTKGRYYRYIVVAVSGSTATAVSKTIHAATSGGKVGNPLKVTIRDKKAQLRLKKKSTRRFKASASIKNGKGKVKNHRKLSWESSNPQVATVNGRGRITAISAGSCYVYAYAQNGVSARIRVTVKP